MQLIDEKLDLDMCACISGWHELEKRQPPGVGEDIIDMNLSGTVKSKEYKYRHEVLKDIEYFQSLPEVKNHDLINRKLTAHKYFILRLMGAVFSFNEYTKNTVGIIPEMYTDKKITALQEKANTLLAPFNLKMQGNVRDDLSKKDRQVKPEDMVALFNQQHEKMYAEISKKTGIQANFNIHHSQIDKDISMMAQIQGDGKDYSVVMNMFHVKKKGETAFRYLATHEISAHAVQFARLRQKVDAGLMPRFMGCVTVHEGIQYGAEGLAETLHDFYPTAFEMTEATEAVMAVDRLKRATSNNASIMANNGENFQDCLNYLHTNAPDFPIGQAAHMLGFLVNKPVGSCYHQVYSNALEVFYQLAQFHPDKDKFIKSVFDDFLMPEQIYSQVKYPIRDFV